MFALRPFTRRAPAFRLAAQQHRAMSGIAVNNVSRIAKFKVAGEDDAVAVDALVDKARAPLAGLAGYSKCVRKVCKAEWDYEVTVVFNGLDNFRAYMESDVRENEVAPILAEITEKYAVGGDVHSQNFVYEEY